MKRHILITLAMLLMNIPLQVNTLAGKGPRAGNSPPNEAGDIVSALPYEELSEFEIGAILYMREEEKLARDTYHALFEIWGTTVFQSISVSEQRHMDAVGALLEKYDLSDPALKAEGTFSNGELQNLYDLLVETGCQSEVDGLWVGATIEDLDISDLQVALAQVDNTDIQVVFGYLLNGSRNHLRAYTRLLSAYGVTYEAQYLSAEEVDEIISSPTGKGRRGVNENGIDAGRGKSSRSNGRRVAYSADDLIELTGIVTDVKAAIGQQNAAFTLDETVTVMAGPYRLWAENGFELQAGDEVKVLVVACAMSPDVWVAVHIVNVTTGAELTLRTEQASPTGKGSQERGHGKRGPNGN